MLNGYPVPLSTDEYTDWMALWNLEDKERKAEERKAKAGSRGRRGRRR